MDRRVTYTMNHINPATATGILFCLGAFTLVVTAESTAIGFAGLCFLCGSALFLYSAVRHPFDETP